MESAGVASGAASLTWLGSEMAAIEAMGRRRVLHTLSGTGPHVVVAGKPVLNLCSNDYLGLTRHLAVIAAVRAAAKVHGTGSGSSRLIAGTHPLHEELEAGLARLKAQEGALVMGSGMLANLGSIPALAGPGDLIVSDELNHASIVDGCRLSRADVRVYPHGDAEAAEAILSNERATHRRALLVTDGVFSMDGDLAPLGRLARAAARHDATLYVDDAHGTGVLGDKGSGTAEHLGVEGVDVHMGTMSKALGAEGGFIAGSGALRDHLVNRCRTFIFSTAPPPSSMAAGVASIAVVGSEPGLRRRLLRNSRHLRGGLQKLGFRVPEGQTPILPVLVGGEAPTMRLMEALRQAGVWASGIRPPTVPAGSCRLRVTVQAGHTEEDLEAALAAFERAGRASGVL